jgi:heme-degrading monooxygenase HmoA
MTLYTLGVWTVKEGREDEFLRAWEDMATRTKAEFPAPTATLLRDRDKPNVFISYGPWPSLDVIEQWRNSETFKDGVGRIRALLEGFEAHTMDAAVEIG